MGAAGSGDDVAVRHQRFARPHPLVGAGDIVDLLARPEEDAEHRVDARDLTDLTRTRSRQCLIEVDETLIDAICHHVQRAQPHKRVELEVSVAEAAAGRDRVAKQRLAYAHLLRRLSPGHERPSVCGRVISRARRTW